MKAPKLSKKSSLLYVVECGPGGVDGTEYVVAANESEAAQFVRSMGYEYVESIKLTHTCCWV